MIGTACTVKKESVVLGENSASRDVEETLVKVASDVPKENDLAVAVITEKAGE